MKRLLSLLLALTLLTGCAALPPSEYVSMTPNAGVENRSGDETAVSANDYESLRRAILSFVREGIEEGTILVTSYDGDVESDLTEAAYEVSKLNPLGAYAVDYMTHDCVRIVSYYEIHIRTTFRRTKTELSAIRNISGDPQLKLNLQLAVERGDDSLTIRMTDYRDQDFAAIVEEYCAAHPDTVLETPQVTFSTYPDSGSTRIVEIRFQYVHSATRRQSMRLAVEESIAAAAEYIRYRQTEQEKAELLYTYLAERFFYTERQSVTPLYDALCLGIASDRGLALAWQQICDLAGVECYTVEGAWAGNARMWNIVSVDGDYRHLDLARCILELGELTLWTDAEMTDYYWDTERFPACEPEEEQPPVEEEQPPVEEETGEEPTDDTPEEET